MVNSVQYVLSLDYFKKMYMGCFCSQFNTYSLHYSIFKSILYGILFWNFCLIVYTVLFLHCLIQVNLPIVGSIKSYLFCSFSCGNLLTETFTLKTHQHMYLQIHSPPPHCSRAQCQTCPPEDTIWPQGMNLRPTTEQQMVAMQYNHSFAVEINPLLKIALASHIVRVSSWKHIASGFCQD